MLKALENLRTNGSHRLAVMLFLSMVAIAIPGKAATPNYEPDAPKLKASQLLPKKTLKGTNHAVREQVVNRGFMNHYRITSPFGEFSAESDALVIRRAHEIAAIAELKKTSKTKVFAESISSVVTKPIGTIGKVVDNPKGTVAGVSAGVGRLFRRTVRRTQDAYEKAKEVAEAEKNKQSGQVAEQDDTASKVTKQGKKMARGYLGVNSALRKLARELKVDPYTDNAVLREQLNSIAKVAATGSFGTKLVMPSLPVGLDQLADVSNLVWTLNPLDLQLRNEKGLKKMGANDGLIKRFYKNPHYTPTAQTRIVIALEQLAGVTGRPVIVRYASAMESPEEARFAARLVELLAKYHKTRAPISQIVETDRIPFAITKKGKGVVAAPVDYLFWTQAAAGTAKVLFKAMKRHTSAPEVWVQGRVSTRAQTGLKAMGWTVFGQAFAQVKR